MSTATQNLTLGQSVVYTDTSGRAKPAFILGTAESVQEGTQVPVPAEGQAHLVVFGYRGVYYKFSVPSLALVEQMTAQGNTDFENGGYFVV